MSLQCRYCSKIITGEVYNCLKCSTQICPTCANNASRCHCGGEFQKRHIAGLMGQLFGTTGVVIIIIVAAIIYMAKHNDTSKSLSNTSYNTQTDNQSEKNKGTDLNTEQNDTTSKIPPPNTDTNNSQPNQKNDVNDGMNLDAEQNNTNH